ncbi:MAG TPA: hypothetical protein DEP66_00010 [Acidimicrobiaceae bacterium]|nr:hypothetical protein [Acidimicrobiaceae bacterium]HCB36633.1 hypothetical protein [Acidimicrobiaceae bacterium]
MTEDEIPPEGRSDLVLTRVKHYRDTIRSYTVLVDGEFVGRIREGQEETFTLRPGRCTVRLKLLWIYSPKVEVDLPPAGQTRMVCGPNGGILQAWRLFVAPFTAIFLRRETAGADGEQPHPRH